MNEQINDMEFDNLIKGKDDRSLLEFVARQSYETCKQCAKEDSRITALENRDKRTFGIVGGVAGFVGTALGAAILAIYRALHHG